MREKILTKRCRRALKNGDLEKAMELAKQLVEVYPNNFSSWHCLGEVYYSVGDTEKAFESFNKAKELASSKEELVNVYLYMGEILIDTDRLDDALMYFNRALTLAEYVNKGVAYILSRIADVYFRKGEFEESLKYYDEAFKAGEAENADEEFMVGVINNLSVVLTKLGYYKDAIELLKDLLTLGTVSDNLFLTCISEINLGTVYLATGNKNAAKRYLKSALNHAKKLGDRGLEAVAYMRLGKALNKKSYLEKAEELFRELELDSTNLQ
ncbi:MAG: tetratricopeptide repeat protein [Sulfurihydrogenibium sp.]|jgi:tetratricopeptide (TPR) repeat protein|nr:tetratricopeptide repeat protein [Sulfurihydrogenibium sp.]